MLTFADVSAPANTVRRANEPLLLAMRLLLQRTTSAEDLPFAGSSRVKVVPSSALERTPT